MEQCARRSSCLRSLDCTDGTSGPLDARARMNWVTWVRPDRRVGTVSPYGAIIQASRQLCSALYDSPVPNGCVAARHRRQRSAHCPNRDRPWTTRRGSDRTDFPNAADRPEVVGVTDDRPASFERSMQARGAGRARGGRDAQGTSGVAERRRSEVMRAARPEEAVQRTTKTPLAERHLPNATGSKPH